MPIGTHGYMKHSVKKYFFVISSVVFIIGLISAIFFWSLALAKPRTAQPSLVHVPQVTRLDIQKKQETQQVPRQETIVETPTISSATMVEERRVPSIPPSMNLVVPFTSQAPERDWSQPWQDACEEAVVLMLDSYEKGYPLSIAKSKSEILRMVAWEEARGWGLSIDVEQIRQLLTYVVGSRRNIRIVENPAIDDLKAFVAAGHPIYVVADGRALQNPHFRNGGPEYHTLLIRGYTPDGFITNDPGTRLGENYFYRYDILMNAIHDWNDGDVKNGRRVVIVIE